MKRTNTDLISTVETPCAFSARIKRFQFQLQEENTCEEPEIMMRLAFDAS